MVIQSEEQKIFSCYLGVSQHSEGVCRNIHLHLWQENSKVRKGWWKGGSLELLITGTRTVEGRTTGTMINWPHNHSGLTKNKKFLPGGIITNDRHLT